jgi:hypothetical protein
LSAAEELKWYLRMVLSVTCHQYPFSDKPRLHREREREREIEGIRLPERGK